jgi:hypothetical protein
MSGKFLARASALSLALFLAACGGDENSADLTEVGDPPTPLTDVDQEINEPAAGDTDVPTESAALPLLPGYYSTKVVTGGSEFTGATILDPEGRFRTFIPDTDLTYGVLEGLSEGQISGQGRNIVYDGSSWQKNTGVLTGSASDKSNATLSLESNTTDYQSEVSIARVPEYSDITITLEDISGTFLMQQPGWLTTEITVQEDGSISGNDESGCIFTGEANIPNLSYSVLRVSFIASNCGDTELAGAEQRNGAYAGLGIFVGGDQLIVFASNDTVPAYFNGLK